MGDIHSMLIAHPPNNRLIEARIFFSIAKEPVIYPRFERLSKKPGDENPYQPPKKAYITRPIILLASVIFLCLRPMREMTVSKSYVIFSSISSLPKVSVDAYASSHG